MKRCRNFFVVVTLVVASASFAQTNTGVPPMPPTRSPVDTFRELLGMSGAERNKALADRSPEVQQRLREKVREYQAMPVNERELKLRATELRWWLLTLMRQAAANDVVGLAMVPTDLLPMVTNRLATWRSLFSPAMQQEFLENEDVRELFVRVKHLTPSQREKILSALPPDRRKALEAGLERWTKLSKEEQRRTCENFENFFAFSERERSKVLNTLSDAERLQIVATLNSFKNLTTAQRRDCVQSFEKFAAMSAAERQQFLRNADRWEKMSPEERQRWRDLVKRVPDFPPMPVDFYQVERPPMPPKSFPPSPTTNNGG